MLQPESKLTLLTSEALHFWKIRDDPISALPLQFERYSDYQVLVKTSTILVMKDLVRRFRESPFPMTYIVKGDRGSGKTTAMKYLNKILDEEVQNTKKCFPIFCGIAALQDDDPESIRESVHFALLDSITNSILRAKDRVPDLKYCIDVSTAFHSLEEGNMQRIDNDILDLLEGLNAACERLVIFVDNLDKADPHKYNIYEEYFLKEQDFLEKIFKNHVYMFISLQDFMAARFRNNKDLSYLGDNAIEVGTWTKQELNELIANRLKLVYIPSPEHFELNRFFNEDALNVVYTMTDHTPRMCLIAVKALLQRASDLSRETKMDTKPITKLFCCKHLPDILYGFRTEVIEPYDRVDETILREYSVAFNMVTKCLEKNDDIARELVIALLSIWQGELCNDQMAIDVLLQQGIIRAAAKNKYEVTERVSRLLNYMYNVLSKDAASVRYFMLSRRTM